jgi:hypothetical protein
MVSMSGAMVIVYAAFIATWAWVSHGFSMTHGARPGIDFSIFWAASHLMLQGAPSQVYEHFAFTKAQMDLFGGFADAYAVGWVYPPAFLAAVIPFALLPLSIAYLLFTALGAWLYTSATMGASNLARVLRTKRLAALVVVASPGVFVAAVIGQNSLLTAALAGLAVSRIVEKPVAAGIFIGLLAIKPQMAIVFPCVLIATRAWKVLAAAALSAIATTIVGVIICGVQSLPAFFVNASVLRDALLDHGGQGFWFASPTTFSALRLAGMPVLAAYAGHVCAAAVAIGAACHVWRNCQDVRLRTAVLTIAALLASPYVWHYELAWLGVALACIGAMAFEGGWLRGEKAAWTVGWLLPIYEHFNRLTMLPQIGPLVLLTLLWLVLQRAGAGAGRPQ